MKREFMLYVKNAGDTKAALSEEKHLEFVKECEVYIGWLNANGHLVAAQPIVREGVTISQKEGKWIEKPVDPSGVVHVGYYHILASDMEEAISIARRNPEFEYVPSASIEVRPIKMREEKTGFLYPKGKE